MTLRWPWLSVYLSFTFNPVRAKLKGQSKTGIAGPIFVVQTFLRVKNDF